MSARRLLVVPLLSPLLAVVLVAALNPGPALSFRILTWVTPRAPLGLWLGGAALGGAALSGAGTALALRQGQGGGSRGRRRVSARTSRPWGQASSQEEMEWPTTRTPSRSPSRGASHPEPWPSSAPGAASEDPLWRRAQVGVAPPRSPGEPPPTVDVPFRILQRPPQASPARQREAVPVGGNDDWGGEAAAEDW